MQDLIILQKKIYVYIFFAQFANRFFKKLFVNESEINKNMTKK